MVIQHKNVDFYIFIKKLYIIGKEIEVINKISEIIYLDKETLI